MGNNVSLCDSIGLKRQLTVVVLGLDNAGKTSTSRALVGDTFMNVTPTIGFSKLVTKHRGITINLYDLGGNSKIREIWHNYFPEAYGVVYVIDASDSARMEEAQLTLTSLMENPMLKGKPFLLLANKQDSEQALDEIDVAEKLHLELLANEHQTPTRIEVCSATQGTGKSVDPVIRIGFQWLIESILQQFDNIHQRVSADVAAQKAEEQEKKDARKERIRKNKENNSNEDDSAPIPVTPEVNLPIANVSATGDWSLPGSVVTNPISEQPELIQMNSTEKAVVSNGELKEQVTNPLEEPDEKLFHKTLPPLRKLPSIFN